MPRGSNTPQLAAGYLIYPSTYRAVDGKVLENRERVYFFTDYLNHVSYVKFIAALREKGIPFGYLGSVNVESVVRRVYEDLVMGKGGMGAV